MPEGVEHPRTEYVLSQIMVVGFICTDTCICTAEVLSVIWAYYLDQRNHLAHIKSKTSYM